MKKFIFALNFFLINTAYSKPIIYEWEKIKLMERSYLFLNHPSSFYDETSSVKDSSVKILNWAKQNNIKTILSIADSKVAFKNKHNFKQAIAPLNSYYIQPEQSDYILYSIGGAHELTFENATTIYFIGGVEYLCLCEAIRDVIHNSKSSELEIVLIANAVFVATGKLSEQLQVATKNPNLLRDYYLKNLIGASGSAFCPHQNSTNKQFNKSLYSFSMTFRSHTFNLTDHIPGSRKIIFKILEM